MSQKQTQTLTQKLGQKLHISALQLQTEKLLELSIADFEQRVKEEVMENPALEEGRLYDDDEMDRNNADSSDEMEKNDTGDDPYSEKIEDDDYANLSAYDSDDLPVSVSNRGNEERNVLPIGDKGSFIEYLESQMMNYDLDETQQEVMHYLIGLLDNRGFIDLPLHTIVDELAFKQYIYVDEEYVAEVLKILQNFDPAGIGAKDVQECLLLQIDRKLDEDVPITELGERFLLLQRKVIADHYDLFLKKRKDKLKAVLGVNDAIVEALFAALKKLNVNTGLSLGESANSCVETQIPDFIVETDLDGNIEMKLNAGDVPRLHVSREYLDHRQRMKTDPDKFSRSEKEEFAYKEEKRETAQMFIECIKQRRRTMHEVMKTIIDIQRAFILSKDEDDKVRMVLKDVADRTGYDISTVSRVCNSKCCLLDGRIYNLSDFFKLTRTNSSGDEVDGAKVKELLQALVDAEDKDKPYTDEQLAKLLTKSGINIARRTVAKYRNELGIPSLAERKND